MMVEMHSKSKNIDLIVLGAGAGGLTAAAVAATEGLQVLVLEKASQVGGTTAISGGMIWAPNSHLANAPDSLEKAKTYLDAVVPTDAGQSQRRTFLERAPEMIAYLEKNTSVKLQAVPIYPDYEVDAPGAFGEVGVFHGAEGRQLRAPCLQQVQGVLVVKAKGFVLSDSNPGPLRLILPKAGPRWRSRGPASRRRRRR